jgi:hypothetical protein
MNADGFEAAVREGIATGKWERLEDWIWEECTFVDNEGTPSEGDSFSGEVFQNILSLLRQQDFLDADGSFNVLRILENEWALLSGPQKEQLLPALLQAYPKFKDWMSWFLIAEILGDYFVTPAALDALRQLKGCRDEKARSLIPMGLGDMVKKSPDEDLAGRAYRELIGMRNDPSEAVRGEVETSLQRIAAQAPDRMG